MGRILQTLKTTNLLHKVMTTSMKIVSSMMMTTWKFFHLPEVCLLSTIPSMPCFSFFPMRCSVFNIVQYYIYSAFIKYFELLKQIFTLFLLMHTCFILIAVDDNVDNQRKKKNPKKWLKKKSKVVESDDKSISWFRNSGTCIRGGSVSDDKCLKKRSQVVQSDDESDSRKLNGGSCIRNVVYVSDSEDGIPISSVSKNKKAAKNIVSESNACGDAPNPKVDCPIRNDDPKR